MGKNSKWAQAEREGSYIFTMIGFKANGTDVFQTAWREFPTAISRKVQIYIFREQNVISSKDLKHFLTFF